MKLLLTAIALCSTCYYGAVIEFESPKQQLFVLNQKINVVYQLLDLECPHYVNKRDAENTVRVSLHVEIAERLFTKLLGELYKCRRETSAAVIQTATPSATPDAASSTAATVSYRDCQDYYEQGHSISGVYEIDSPNSTLPPFNVWCDFADGYGWIVIQRRTDATSFYKSWDEYKNGFGDINGHHWLGNDKIHLLTQTNQKLNISLMASDGEERWAAYSLFRVADEADKYRLTISRDGFSGSLGDWLSQNHNNQMFSTTDDDNDLNPTGSCADEYKAGWWYQYCSTADLNKGDSSGMYWGDGLWDFELSVMRIGRE